MNTRGQVIAFGGKSQPLGRASRDYAAQFRDLSRSMGEILFLLGVGVLFAAISLLVAFGLVGVPLLIVLLAAGVIS